VLDAAAGVQEHNDNEIQRLEIEPTLCYSTRRTDTQAAHPHELRFSRRTLLDDDVQVTEYSPELLIVPPVKWQVFDLGVTGSRPLHLLSPPVKQERKNAEVTECSPVQLLPGSEPALDDLEVTDISPSHSPRILQMPVRPPAVSSSINRQQHTSDMHGQYGTRLVTRASIARGLSLSHGNLFTAPGQAATALLPRLTPRVGDDVTCSSVEDLEEVVMDHHVSL
jgi:hypothetical protein